MTQRKTIQKISLFIFLITYACFTTNFFNFVPYTSSILQRHWYFHVAVLLVLFAISYRKFNSFNNVHFESYILFFAFFPYLVALLKPFHAGGTIEYELGTCFDYTTVFIFYYYFYKQEISADFLIKILVVFGTLTFVIQLFQQLNPTLPVFGINLNAIEETNELAYIRNGLYRFHIGAQAIQMFCLLYSWDRLLNKFSILNLVFTIIFAVSIYLYLTRQVMIASAASMSILLFFKFRNRHNKWGLISILLIAIFSALYFWETIFAGFVDDYTNDTYTIDIRQEAMEFIIPQIFENPLTVLFGHGHQIIERNSWNARGYYMSDIGFIGQAYYYGVIWIIVFYSLCYKVLFKLRNIPFYIKSFIIGSCIMSPFIFPFTNKASVFLWTCLIYLISVYEKNMKNYE